MQYIPYTNSLINYYKSIEKDFKLKDVKAIVIVERNGDKNLETILGKVHTIDNKLIITKKPGDIFLTKEITEGMNDDQIRELKYITFSNYPEIGNKDCNEYVLLVTNYCVLPLPSIYKDAGLKKYKSFFDSETELKSAMSKCISEKNFFTYRIKTYK